MAKSMAAAIRNAQAQVVSDALDSGYIRVYAGSVPASADAALGGATLLAELTFGNPSTGAPASGVITANAINSDPSANATGTAAFYRTFQSDGTTVVEQGTVGTSGADMIVPTVSVVSGVEFRVTSYTHSVP
jgi:hypothetical protein